MKIVVFLGPTLPITDAQVLLDAHYLPPAAMGDVYDAVDRLRPDIIAIIDGYFDSVPSVWHKEILFALSRGVRVVGASSMGALRAAELTTFGMEGFGWVYEAFCSGTLEDDDEVAVVHSEDYRPLSTAMVNLRVGLLRACNRGLIGKSAYEAMLTLAKRRYYPQRSWETLLREAAIQGVPADELLALRCFVERERPDIKREDACGLLTKLPEAPAGRPPAADAELTPTIFWDKLTKNEQRLPSSANSVIRLEALRRFVKATDRDLAGLLRDGLLIHLVEKECAALCIELEQGQFDAAVREFRLQRDLISAESMCSWLERERLTQVQFHAIMQVETRIATLLALYRSDIDERLLDALALSGSLGEAVARHAGAEESTREDVTNQPHGLSASEIEAFYRSNIRQFSGSLQRHARDLGFASGSELLDEVRKIYIKT